MLLRPNRIIEILRGLDLKSVVVPLANIYANELISILIWLSLRDISSTDPFSALSVISQGSKAEYYTEYYTETVYILT